MKFKEYHQYQERAFPIQLEEFIRENNPARLISDLVDKIDLKILSKSFNSSEEDKGGNRPYHPGMMLKIWKVHTKSIHPSLKICNWRIYDKMEKLLRTFT